MNLSAVIVAAGSSRRMGFDKLSADLSGESVLLRSINAFQNCDAVTEIIVVSSKDRIESIKAFNVPKLKVVVEGGTERHLSVWNGLKAISTDATLIAVHDGARPLVTTDAIERCADIASEAGAASLAHRIVDTLKRSNPGETSAAESVSREDLWAMETPQIFQTEILMSAYQEILTSEKLVTDEVSAVQATGHSVQFVENPDPNLKITVAADLSIAEALIQQRC